MKKIIALILALVMVLALCACGGSGVKLKILDSEYVTEDMQLQLQRITTIFSRRSTPLFRSSSTTVPSRQSLITTSPA